MFILSSFLKSGSSFGAVPQISITNGFQVTGNFKINLKSIQKHIQNLLVLEDREFSLKIILSWLTILKIKYLAFSMYYRSLLYIGYLSSCTFSACQQKVASDQEGGIPSIPIEHDPQTEIFLDDISSDYISIPLEMTEESLIHHITDVAISEKFLYVNDKNGILQFDLKGKFIKKIGAIGEAPGNYQSVWSLTFDPSDKTIVVADYMLRKTMKFNEFGDFMGASEKFGAAPFYITPVPDGYVTMTDYFASDGGSGRLLVTDIIKQNKKLEIIDTLKSINLKVGRNLNFVKPHPSFISQFDSINYFYLPLFGSPLEPIVRDTLFRVSYSGEINPILKFPFSGKALNEEGNSRYYIKRIDVNNRYYFVTYFVAGDPYLFGYDREKEKSWVVRDGLRVKKLEGHFLPRSKGKMSYLITQGYPDEGKIEPNPTVHLINW